MLCIFFFLEVFKFFFRSCSQVESFFSDYVVLGLDLGAAFHAVSQHILI